MIPLLKHLVKHPANGSMPSPFRPAILSPTITTVAVVGLLCAMLCGGCGDDDKGSNSILAPQSGAIEGTWDLARVTSEWNGQVYEVPEEIVESDPLTYQFRDGGTGQMQYQGKTHELTWQAQGNRMHMESPTMVFEVYDYTISAMELTFEFDVEDEGEVYHISHIFERR